MSLLRNSPCKVNLLLNVLGKRPDGFHELETVLLPVNLCDELEFKKSSGGIQLTCSEPTLPADASNLVHRAARAFLTAAGIRDGVQIHLEKKIPMAAGLGGGSGNAAATLLALNELFENPLTAGQLHGIAATLGSDVPFFLQTQPALATGRGEQIVPLAPFPALRSNSLLLIHPGFGISTPWVYQQLTKHPSVLQGQPGRARALIDRLQQADLAAAKNWFYNALEAPVLPKYPLLALFQQYLRDLGAPVAMMSGSGSSTFALVPNRKAAADLLEKWLQKFGPHYWTAITEIE